MFFNQFQQFEIEGQVDDEKKIFFLILWKSQFEVLMENGGSSFQKKINK